MPARGGGAGKEGQGGRRPVISSEDFALRMCPSFRAEGSVFPPEPGILIFLSEKS